MAIYHYCFNQYTTLIYHVDDTPVSIVKMHIQVLLLEKGLATQSASPL